MAGTPYALGRSGWIVAGLAVFRIALPFLALGGLGGTFTPDFDYDGLTGDATGFYAAVREIVASWADLPKLLVVALGLLVLVAGAFIVVAWGRRPDRRGWLVVGATAVLALVFCAPIAEMSAPGAGVIGWPLVWSLPLHPWLWLGLPLGPDGAFVVAVVLSLAANVVSVVATAYAGLYATGRRTVAVGSAALFAFWPVLIGLVVGDGAWENGSFTVDAGLVAYSEPLSTALVTVALALLLSPRVTDVRLATAGAALGLAATVKLTNGLLAAAALALVAMRHGRRALLFAAAGASFIPLMAIFWPKGYPAVLDEDPDLWPDDAFSLGNADAAWRDSHVFTPTLLLLLVPLAVVGAVALRSAYARRLLVLWALVNPIVYSVYFITPDHPRVLFASLPAAFVLWMNGGVWLLTLRRRVDRPVARGDPAIAAPGERTIRG